MRRNNGGFTLIELIVVIVILGILAVTAAPKFIDLQSDARLATLNGMKAAINSAVSLAYGKSLVTGQEKLKDGSITINGSSVAVCYGYPCAASEKIQKVLDIGDFKACTAGVAGDWCFQDGETTASSGETTASSIKIFVANGYSSESKCYVEYTQPDASGKAPTVALPSDVSC